MTRNCKCGGKLHRTDIVQDMEATRKYGYLMFRDTDDLKANWKCDRCGKVRTQRKRQSHAQA